jgi:hypothetical protein
MWLSPPTSTPRRKSSTHIITVVIRCNPRNLRPRSSAPQAIPLNVIPIIVNITTLNLVIEGLFSHVFEIFETRFSHVFEIFGYRKLTHFLEFCIVSQHLFC